MLRAALLALLVSTTAAGALDFWTEAKVGATMKLLRRDIGRNEDGSVILDVTRSADTVLLKVKLVTLVGRPSSGKVAEIGTAVRKGLCAEPELAALTKKGVSWQYDYVDRDGKPSFSTRVSECSE